MPSLLHARRFPPKRILRLLILGALLNILITTAIAYLDPGPFWNMNGVEIDGRDRNPYAGEGEGHIELHRDPTRFGVYEYVAYVGPLRPPMPGVPPRPLVFTFSQPPSRWAQTQALPWERALKPWPTTKSELRVVRLVGWPAQCLWNLEEKSESLPTAFTQMGARTMTEVRGGIELLQPPKLIPWPARRILPYRPLWLGLVLNTLFYTAALTALSMTPRWYQSLRQHLRGKPGHCPACRYNLQGLPPLSPCPECGRATPSR